MEEIQLANRDETFNQNIYYIGLFVIEIYHQELDCTNLMGFTLIDLYFYYEHTLFQKIILYVSLQ